MRGDRSIWLAGFVMLGVLAGGCSSEEPTTPAAPAPPTALSPTPEPTPSPDPYAIPDDPADIDEAYVERVLEALVAGIVEATRAFAKAGEVTPAVESALLPTHTAEARKGYLRTFRDLETEEKARFRADATAIDITSVDEIISASRSCIFVRVTQDTSGLVKEKVRPFANYFYLVAEEPESEKTANRVPWRIAGDAKPRPDGEEYASPCEE